MTKLTQMTLEKDGNGEKDGVSRRRIHLREISGDSESPLESVGQDLRAARLRRGDEIAEVSRALKIRKDHLEALENDRLEDLPGKTYAIGFVRSYARHLGLDSAQFVERFKQDISGRAEEQVREPAPIHQDADRRLPQGWRLIAGAVGILLIWGAWHLLFSGGASNQPVPPAPVLNPPKTISRPAPAPVVAPAQTATPSPAADAAPPAAATDQQASATPPPAAGAKTPETQSAPLSTASPTAQAAVPAVSNGAGQVYGALNRNPRVILRARADTRVTVRGPDNQFLLNRDLKTGDSYLVPDMPGITMATSDAGAVEMDLDGIALGRAGAPQQVLGRVSLDPQSLADRFNNR
ncbi:MAG TPA: RodZ domain-containing protein [Nevskia sp.]|nr:RodZ domain-containing protein [Nevskia sp.]